ncbi:hypothetical protein BH23ACT9_BH23ACT9_06040 [soil metagenome]
MTIDQLRALMEEAARDLVDRTERPHPTTVVVPLPGSTRVLALEGFPDEDAARKQALSVVAAEHMVPDNAACFGFLAEATGPGGEDLLLVVYGARQRGSHLTAALMTDGGLGDFVPAEPLEATAMPFLQPLQHAADLAPPAEGAGPDVPGLPIIGQ